MSHFGVDNIYIGIVFGFSLVFISYLAAIPISAFFRWIKRA